MFRATQIKDKLIYVESRRQQLMTDMFQAKKAGIEVKHIIHSASEILSTARECYDYCANDIEDNLVIPRTVNKKLISKYNSGNMRVYFPFRSAHLQNDTAFSELQYTNSGLYEYLIRFSFSISVNENIPNTLLKYGDILQLNEMVNTKKHDCLLCVQSIPNSELLVEQPGMRVIIPSRGQSGWNTVKLSPNSYASSVSEFLFEYNNREVGHFCLFASESTKIILDRIYNIFFNSSIK